MDQRRGTVGFLLILSINLCFAKQKGEERNCEPGIKVQRNTSHNVSVGDRLKISCPVSFCDNSPPTVTWFKLETDDYEPVRMSNRVKTKWEIIGNSEGISYFIIENVQGPDGGEYQCRAGNDVGHNIMIHVTGVIADVIPTLQDQTNNTSTDGPNKQQLWLYLYTSVGIVGFVLIVIIISFLSMRGCNVNERDRETDINMSVSQPAVVEGEEMDTYAALQQPNDDLYQTIVHVDSAGVSGSRRQSLHSEGDYENVKNFAN